MPIGNPLSAYVGSRRLTGISRREPAGTSSADPAAVEAPALAMLRSAGVVRIVEDDPAVIAGAVVTMHIGRRRLRTRVRPGRRAGAGPGGRNGDAGNEQGRRQRHTCPDDCSGYRHGTVPFGIRGIEPPAPSLDTRDVGRGRDPRDNNGVSPGGADRASTRMFRNRRVPRGSVHWRVHGRFDNNRQTGHMGRALPPQVKTPFCLR
jgi:hypothetical protein